MKKIEITVANPFNKQRPELIQELQKQVTRLEAGKTSGCELHDILTAVSAMIALGEGLGCCAAKRNIVDA